jgi:phenylalanyl-tRNA synthetase alpha subunit
VPEIKNAIKNNEISISAANELAKLQPEVQVQAVKDGKIVKNKTDGDSLSGGIAASILESGIYNATDNIKQSADKNAVSSGGTNTTIADNIQPPDEKTVYYTIEDIRRVFTELKYSEEKISEFTDVLSKII